ncbi:hypothetical protein [Alkalihalobacterium alkalinitrilicum]|uniref:hypothetical protein n=1 Tax=Alkalihalobacterium alkalinitrilicum TaxID=427920 RepID=UPI000995BDE5|nr:hypothetical protein [Alkalihalobacterium alkalinitrilicum]
MSQKYHLESGYMTVPDANRMVLNMLRITNLNEKSHYKKILAGAKKGLFGGKKHGTRMYQVRKDDINEYVLKCLQEEQLKLFNIEVVKRLDEVEAENRFPLIDNSTAKNIQYYLKYLKFYGIISDETFQLSEKKLVLRVNLKELRGK